MYLPQLSIRLLGYTELVLDASDPNCGAAFKAAEDDTLLGWIDGCGQPNPSIAPMPPTVSPVCT